MVFGATFTLGFPDMFNEILTQVITYLFYMKLLYLYRGVVRGRGVTGSAGLVN